jgi:2-methylcitrate dehydratase PrpD
MASPILSLAEWARSVRPADIPDDVLRLARLQHIGAAGAVRAAAQTPSGAALVNRVDSAGSAPVVGGRTASPAVAAATHAGLSAAYEYDDFLLAGRAGLGSVPLPWAVGTGRRLDELLAATVVGNEIAGRIGLAALLGPRANRADTHVPAAAGAAAAAWLAGLDARGIASAVSLALAGGARLAPGEFAADPSAVGSRPAAAALAAVEAASAGRGAPDLAILDAESRFYAALCEFPLMGAYGGLGRSWLTRTLVVKPDAAMAWAGVAVQGVHEILERHIKAADKRLRSDQVERIELRVGLLPWAMDAAGDELEGFSPAGLAWSIKRALAVLIARHGLRPEDLTPAALAEKRDEIEQLAQKVQVVHDWSLSVATVEHFTRVLGPLFTGMNPLQLRAVRTRLKAAGGWPRWHREDLWPIARSRPDRVLWNLRAPPGDLGDVDLDAFRWHLPIEVKLYTTRGGWWPERRALPLGSVATHDIEAVALAKHGGAAANTALAAPADAPADRWVAELLA